MRYIPDGIDEVPHPEEAAKAAVSKDALRRSSASSILSHAPRQRSAATERRAQLAWVIGDQSARQVEIEILETHRRIDRRAGMKARMMGARRTRRFSLT
jgi:hypothetical protein